MSDKLYLVTFSCLGDDRLFTYCECVTPSPVDTLLAIRKDESERQAKVRKGVMYSLRKRQFNIINVIEVTAEQAELLQPSTPVTAAEWKAKFERTRVNPDAIVEAIDD